MVRAAVADGVRIGVVLSGVVVLLALVATAPAFASVPEMPLLALAALAPVIACGLTGFRSIRRTRRLPAGTIAGALVGMMAGAVAGLSLLAFNQLFFDTVRMQPDKILNYQASGIPSMREYLLLNGVINIVAGLALGSTGGAVLGGIAALVGKFYFSQCSATAGE